MIRGLVKCSLVDYPGMVCATVFTGGCNLRCPYCHNKGLVLSPKSYPAIPEESLLSFLKERQGFLDGVCLSGGEPACYQGLLPLIRRIKEMGYRVKIDTNGFYPATIKALLDESLLDYAALDVKSSLGKYEEAAGKPVNTQLLQDTAKRLRESKLHHELRTTAVPGLVEAKDLLIIGEEFGGDVPYYLQQFRPDEGTLDPDYCCLTPYDSHTLLEMAAIIEPYFASVKIRGI